MGGEGEEEADRPVLGRGSRPPHLLTCTLTAAVKRRNPGSGGVQV